MRLFAFLTSAVFLAAGPVMAGQIEQACLKSERSKGQRALCGCIQNVADMTLTARDQKLAATFFQDPHRAQEVRQSNSRRHEAFWDRYKNFGLAAQNYCGR